MRERRIVLFALAVPALALGIAACGWDPSRPFERDAPAVKKAIVALGDAGDAATAAALLQDYLSTGPCAEGNIGTPPKVRDKSRGSFDLGLALFSIGEGYGGRFGDEEVDGGGDPAARAARVAQIDCALRLVKIVADDDTQPIELRARARYLEGNLHFLGGEYEDAVSAYDKALTLAPGFPDGGDAVGRDAAWNRAIALRRIEDKKNDGGKDGGNDAASDGGGNDAGSDGGGDGGADGGSDGGGDGGAGDGGAEGGKPPPSQDGGSDGGQGPDAGEPPPPSGGQDASAPPPPKESQDDRVLDQLENAPTFQQEAARKQAQQRRVRGVLDK